MEWHYAYKRRKKFNGIDELVAQIAQDKKVAQEYFDERKDIYLHFQMKSSILLTYYNNHYLALRLTDAC